MLNMKQFVYYTAQNLQIQVLVSMEEVKELDAKIYAEMQAAYDHVKAMAEKDEHCTS